MKSLDDIDYLLNRHLLEASEGIVDVSPSRLNRGQAVEKNYYILKIDLARSTLILQGRRKATYLKIIHTFLSTIDSITQSYGADPNQTEYAGDSVLVYFPESVSAENVLRAACFSKVAVERLASMQREPELMRIDCKIVIHFATLIIAKIGPRAGSILSAIGHPIHKVAKLEKEIGAGVGRATIPYRARLQVVNRKYLYAIYEETTQLVQPKTNYSDWVPTKTSLLALALMDSPGLSATIQPRQVPEYEVVKTIIGYNINWTALKMALKLHVAR